MSRKRYTPEQVIGILREAEVFLSQSKTDALTRRNLGISDQTYYRWRKEYLLLGPWRVYQRIQCLSYSA